MKKLKTTIYFQLYFLILLINFQVIAQPAQRLYYLGDFKLESGQTIKNALLGYRTIGKLNADSSNVIIYPTWYGGTSGEVATLIAPDKLIDSDKKFIILFDSFGNGISSSPSISIDQPGKAFPEFTIRDMVCAQYEFLTKELKLRKISAAIGGSMGGMQAFQWAVEYPGFISKIISYVGTPKLTSSELLWGYTQKYLIESGWKFNQPDSVIQANISMLVAASAETGNKLNQRIKTEDFASYFGKLQVNSNKVFTLENRLSQLNAMLAHDISIRFGFDMEKAANAITAKMLIIVSKQDRIIQPEPAIQLAKKCNAQLMVLDNNGGHLAVNQEMEKVRLEIARFLNMIN